MLELVLRLHGEFRRCLEPIHVTPLQAGVMLYLRQHVESRLTEAATALCLKPPTVTDVVKDLVRKGWVTRTHSVKDRRAVRLRLSRQGQALVRKIEIQIRHIEAPFLSSRRSIWHR
jgi:MarR family transcriptional regulator, lower aerobic nicotinate degradation pathway regulator